jgi:hypothetical protein
MKIASALRGPVLPVVLSVGLVCCGQGAVVEQGKGGTVGEPVSGGATAAGAVVGEAFTAVPLWTSEQTPVDFLEAVGQHTKARWRQLYRPPPPTPAPDRVRTAVTLGYLVGESFLCVQAVDAQQFRNNNQEIMTYSRTLGFGERVAPMLLAQAKLAEGEMWEELRVQVIEGQGALGKALLDQRDEELAIILKLGVWLRTMEVVSSVVLEATDADVSGLCVGSPELIKDLREDFGTLSEATREGEVMKEVGTLLDFLWRNWGRTEDELPAAEAVVKTRERLAQTARKVSLR